MLISYPLTSNSALLDTHIQKKIWKNFLTNIFFRGHISTCCKLISLTCSKMRKRIFKSFVLNVSLNSIFHPSRVHTFNFSKKVKIIVAHRVPTPIPPSSTQGKAGRNHLNEEITRLLPTGIGE